jgi:hypothetical protein
MVEGVDDELVKDLEESWIELDLAPDHSTCDYCRDFRSRSVSRCGRGGSIIDPPPLLMRVPRPDVSIRKLENVLALGQFLIRGHRTSRVGYGCGSSL